MNGTRSTAVPPDRGADKLLACFLFFFSLTLVDAKTAFEMSTLEVAGPFKNLIDCR